MNLLRKQFRNKALSNTRLPARLPSRQNLHARMNLRNKQVLNAPIVKGEEDVDECKYCLDTTDIVVKYYGTETQEFILEQEAAYCDSLGGGDPTGVCYFFIAYLSELQYSYVEQGKTSIEVCYDLMKVCE